MKIKNIVLIFCVFMLIICCVSFATDVGNDEANGTPFTFSTYDSGDMKIKSTESNIYSNDEKSGELLLQEEINEVITTDKEKNIMLLGRELNITGEAKDLIMAAGGKIMSKAFGSYAFMAANNLNVSGEIFKDTFAIGNSVDIDGSIGRDLYALGNSVNIIGKVERDVYAGGEVLNISGYVGGDVKFAGGNVIITENAVIAGNIDISAGNIEVEEGATIEGVLSYLSDAEASIPSNIKTNVRQVITAEQPEENVWLSKLRTFLWWSVSNILLFIIMMAICPKMFEGIKTVYEDDTVQKYCSSFGWGFLGLIIIPIISILALFTVVGSAIGVIGFLIYALGFALATVIVSYALANTFLSNISNRFLKGIVGIIIIEFLRVIPIIGGLVGLFINAIAFGTVFKLLKSSKNEENIENIIS